MPICRSILTHKRITQLSSYLQTLPVHLSKVTSECWERLHNLGQTTDVTEGRTTKMCNKSKLTIIDHSLAGYEGRTFKLQWQKGAGSPDRGLTPGNKIVMKWWSEGLELLTCQFDIWSPRKGLTGNFNTIFQHIGQVWVIPFSPFLCITLVKVKVVSFIYSQRTKIRSILRSPMY